MLTAAIGFAAPSLRTEAAEGFTIFLIGDSTMADKPVVPENPERGWGQLLPLYFSSSVSIENHAANGRSSKSFRDEGRWEVVLERMQPGDWVLMQFGHNDEKSDEARHTDPFTSYSDNLRRYASETKQRGGNPVLATPVVRRSFNSQDKLQPTHGDYPQAVRKLAKEIDAPLLDMTSRSRDLLTRLGRERSERLFLWTSPGEYRRFPDGNSDNTHFNALGATRMCDLAVDEIEQNAPKLAEHLKGASKSKPRRLVVAADGSGDYHSVQDAIDAMPKNSSRRRVIFIKPGTYREKIRVPRHATNLKLMGESYENTILTYDDHAGTTRNHASTTVLADDFYAENLTFQNTIDSRKSGSQAQALRVDGDRAIFFQCRITGFQDTYYTGGNKRSYHKQCVIEGTTDFIYGDGIALFEDCTINNRKNSHITAHGQRLVNGKPTNKFGYVFNRCEINAYPGEQVTNASLGRPWKTAARVVFMNCTLGAHIRKAGWSEWEGRDNHRTAYYAEYKNSGSGFSPSDRLPWTHQLTDDEAAEYTKANIFRADTTTATALKGDWEPVIE